MVDRQNKVPMAVVFVAYVSTAIIAFGQSQTKPANQDELVRLRTELVQVLAFAIEG